MDVPTLIRDCRAQAGLSQRELAALAGTSQPALARYERGRATPSIATLQRIVEATGHQLQLGAVAPPAPPSPNATYVTLAGLRADLEDELGVPVDLTTRDLLLPEAYETAASEAVDL